MNGSAGAADSAHGPVRIAVLEHDPSDPLQRLGEWLAEAGAEVDVRRLHAGDEVPGDPAGHDALISLGGALRVYDDESAPWLAETRKLLARAVTVSVPTFAIGLGAQLLAVAAGGRVGRSDRGTDIGAHLVAKRDATDADLLFGRLPITPDVMFFRRDVVEALPGGSELLLAGLTDPIEAFRVGAAAWGVNFHIETSAETLRAWRSGATRDDDAPGSGPAAEMFARVVSEDDLARSEHRCGAMLDEAEAMMGEVWRDLVHRFVELTRRGIPQTPTGRVGQRLPLAGGSAGP